MPFNGSGTYTRPAGQPVVAGTDILDTTFNTYTADVAAALTNCITRDGQSPATANLPIGGFKLTGLAAGTGAGDSVRYEQVIGVYAALAGATFTGLVNLAAGANIASAATVDLTAATGNSPRITGTTATSAVTMNVGQQCLVVADGAWPLTYHATTNKLSGGANYTCTAGDLVLYHKDLSGIVHGVIIPMGIKSMVRVQGYNGYSSTNTVIPRYTTVVTNQGADVTYADSATLGASFTINNPGMYAITAVDELAALSNYVGISKNTTQPTVNIGNITADADVLSIVETLDANNPVTHGWTGYLLAGDVLRPHESGAALGTGHAAKCGLTIARIG